MIKLDSYNVVTSDIGSFKTVTFKTDDDVDIDITFPLDREPYVEINGTVSVDDLLEALELVKSGKVCIEL